MNQFLNIPEENVPVVYWIENTRTKKRYIGKTHVSRYRIFTHIAALEKHYHHNKELQADFDNGDVFEVKLLWKPVPGDKQTVDNRLRKAEYYMIRKYNTVENGYNKAYLRPYIIDLERAQKQAKALS